MKVKTRILAFLSSLLLLLTPLAATSGASTSAVASAGTSDRVVTITGAITPESSYAVISQITALEMVGSKPILLVINSPGGLVDSGMDVVNAMKTAKSPFICIVANEASSMGAVILSYCGKRYISKIGSILFHEVMVILPYPVPISMALNELAREMIESMKAYSEVAANLKMSPEDFWAKIKQGQQWRMNAREALKERIVDGVVVGFNRAPDGHLIIQYTTNPNGF